jgi:hypothetical protein
MIGLSTDDDAACAKRYTHLEQRTTKVFGPDDSLVSPVSSTRAAPGSPSQALVND